ncbi:MAG: DUF488 domain-containing protein [Candidatus Rokuibacteriota bacterium]|nr:MAG: DUF488 domain-containing protein [Candidatus Rokubacteria bacterium]
MDAWSVGHSTRTLEDLVALLHEHGVRLVADVRRFPRSRRHPQFDTAALADALPAAGVAYVHLPGLGGFRRAQRDSPNTAWRNSSFRGYADYMQTDEFAGHLAALVALAGATPTAIMCAEAVPWRCHRSLIADALVARGTVVRHILGPGRADPHALNATARVDGTRVTYPGAPELFGAAGGEVAGPPETHATRPAGRRQRPQSSRLLKK